MVREMQFTNVRILSGLWSADLRKLPDPREGIPKDRPIRRFLRFSSYLERVLKDVLDIPVGFRQDDELSI